MAGKPRQHLLTLGVNFELYFNYEGILIATFYETIDTVKHNLSAVGVDVQKYIDDGSLLIVDAFSYYYYPDISGMKKLVTSLSERAKKERRVGVSIIVNMGYFFLFGGDGKAIELINYEASLLPKTEGNNVKGFNCYHAGDYRNLNDRQKKKLQGQKKLLEISKRCLICDVEEQRFDYPRQIVAAFLAIKQI